MAKEYIDFAERCPEEMFVTPRCGKVGWGASLLFQATGEDHYRQMSLRVRNYLVNSLLPDGTWTMAVEGCPARHVEVDLTAEFVSLLDEMLQGLNS